MAKCRYPGRVNDRNAFPWLISHPLHGSCYWIWATVKNQKGQGDIMQNTIYITRKNISKTLLIAIFSVLISVLTGTAGEVKGLENATAADGNHLISFSRNMNQKSMLLSYDDGTAFQVSASAEKEGLTGKVSGLVNQCIRYFSCQGSRVKLNAFNINTGHFDTSVNAVYNHEDRNVEIGMSSDSLNRRLGDDVEMEFLANPAESSAALMFNIKI